MAARSWWPRSTAALVEGVDLVDLGEHRLRDLSGLTRLFQVRGEGWRSSSRRCARSDVVPGNLPVPTTSFVGREVEVGELVALVRAHRLVTLTGVGGVGKTRLALQVAGELAGGFRDGVWLVELAPGRRPGRGARRGGHRLGRHPPGRADRVAAVSPRRCRVGRLLLVLDNCEHVLGAAGDLVEAILAATPAVTVLATSREGLRVAAEQLWPVPSLAVDDGTTSEAVALFVERARAVRPGFRLDSGRGWRSGGRDLPARRWDRAGHRAGGGAA